MTEGWRNAELQLQPALDWRNFCRHGGAETPSAAAETPGWFGPQFEDCDRFLFRRLRGALRILPVLLRTSGMTRYKHGDAERRDTHPLHRNLLKACINFAT